MTKFNLFLFTNFLSYFLFAQNVSVENKAKALQFRILSEHVLIHDWNDSLSEQVNILFLNFLDPNKIYFSKEQVDKLTQKSSLLSTEIKERKTSYLNEVKEIFLSEMNAFHSLVQVEMNKVTSLKNEKTPRVEFTFKDYCNISQLKERRLYFIQQQVFRELFKLHENKQQISLTEIASDEILARKKIKERQDQLFSLLTKDSRFVDEYYLQAIAQAVDPHTLYFTESYKNNFTSELSVDQERFGFSYGLDASNKVVITNLLPGSSAWFSGRIKENDILQEIGLKVNKEWIFTAISDGLFGLNQLQTLLENYKEKEIYLRVQNGTNASDKVLLKKTKIINDNELVKNAVLGKNQKIGYIQLSDFYTDMTGNNFGNGCANDLAKCILKLKKDNIQGLILDLRGNGGGSLKEAIELTGIFIDYGPILAYSDKSGTVTTLKDANRGSIYDGPLLILIDEESASASEIVAASLQDYGKALIVGQPSYGKATSQQILPIDPFVNIGFTDMSTANPEFGFVNVTEGILYRIDATSNQSKGVNPDIQLPKEFSLLESEREKDLIAVLTAPPISKKMAYTSSTSIPKKELSAWSEEYFKSNEMTSQIEKRRELFDLYQQDDGFLYVDYLTYFTYLKKLENDIDKVLEGSSLFSDSEIRSNSFDENLYAQNEILRSFQEEFRKQLSSDIELKFAVDLMDKWLLILNK